MEVQLEQIMTLKMNLPKSVWTTLVMATSLTGCASYHTDSPTHSWSSDQATISEYRLDNYDCISDAKTEEQELRQNTAQFQEYANCMKRRGYALRTY